MEHRVRIHYLTSGILDTLDIAGIFLYFNHSLPYPSLF